MSNLQVGVNVHRGDNCAPQPAWANLLELSPPGWGIPYAALAPNGMPRDPYPGANKPLLGSMTHQELKAGYRLERPGTFSVVFKGAPPLVYPPVVVGGDVLPHPDLKDRREVRDGWTCYRYDLAAEAGRCSPALSLALDETAANRTTLKGVYGPDVADPFDPPVFHPAWVKHFAGLDLVRTKDLQGTDSSPVALFSQWPSADHTSFSDPAVSGGVNVVRWEPYADPALFAPDEYPVRVYCDAPHGLADGMAVRFEVPGSAFPGQLSYALADGSAVSQQIIGAVCYPIDATSFAIANLAQGQPVKAAALPAGTKLYPVTAGVPPRQLGLLAAALKLRVLWWNIPHAMPADQVRLTVRAILETLPAGCKMIAERSNEPWNWYVAYNQFHHFRRAGRREAYRRAAAGDGSWLARLDETRAWMYMLSVDSDRKVLRDEMAKAGRNPDDVAVVWNSMENSPAVTAQFFDYADFLKIDYADLVVTAGYSRCDGSPASVADAARMAEAHYANWASTSEAQVLAAHADVVRTRGKGKVRYSIYEAGIGGFPGWPLHLAHLPGAKRWARNYLDTLDKIGVSHVAMWGCGIATGVDQGEEKAIAEQLYYSCDQADGDNAALEPTILSGEPLDLVSLASPAGAAVRGFLADRDGAGPPQPPVDPPKPPADTPVPDRPPTLVQTLPGGTVVAVWESATGGARGR